MVVHTLHLSTWEAEAIGFLSIQGQPGLHTKFQANQGFMVRPPSPNKATTKVDQSGRARSALVSVRPPQTTAEGLCQGWRGGSIINVSALQAWGPEFRSPEPMSNARPSGMGWGPGVATGRSVKLFGQPVQRI